MSALRPWPNGAAARFAPSAVTVLSWAMRPSATMARSFGISAIAAVRKLRQVLISTPVGLFSGGTQLHGIGDARVDELQAVVGALLIGAAGEAEAEQRLVEQVAGIVAGERPAGAVGALHAGRQADDQQARGDRPEGRHRRVEPVRMELAANSRGTPAGEGRADNRGGGWRR